MFLLTGLLTSIHFLAIYPLFFLVGIVLFFLVKPTSDETILPYWEVLFLDLLIWLCVFGLKCLVNKAHKEFKAEKYQKCRNNILIGLSFIAIFSLIADKLPEMSSNEMSLLHLFAPVSFITAVYVFFIINSSTHCDWDTKTPSFEFIFGTFFLLAIHTFRFFSTDFSMVQHYKDLDWVQISFFFVSVSSTLEIYAILMGRLVLLNDEEVALDSIVVISMAPVRKDEGTQTSESEDVTGGENAEFKCDKKEESVCGSDEDNNEESSSESGVSEDSRSIIYVDFEIECEPRDDDLEEHVICLECDGNPHWV